MLKVTVGDMFQSGAQTLVNTVNCVGVMGKGVAEMFKKRYPKMFDDYKQRCERGDVVLGKPYIYRDLSGVSIVNFPTKDHWRSVSRLEDIEAGLDHLVKHVDDWGISSIALPPLGCGNGGLEWAEVGPLIYSKLKRLDIPVELFAPYGTPRSQLSEAFLAAPSQLSLEGKGRRAEKMSGAWVVLMEVLKELQDQPYASPVGRTIFQKICYVVTEMGVPTGFSFDKGSYGPFAPEVKKALHDFANRNWVREERLGKMIALKVSDEYCRDRARYADEIGLYGKKIFKTVDLFSRIKSTDQAEQVMTVLYACRQIKAEMPDSDVDEQSIFRYVLDWKKSWDNEEKRTAVADSIRSLVMLGWMRVRMSEDLIEPPRA